MKMVSDSPSGSDGDSDDDLTLAQLKAKQEKSNSNRVIKNEVHAGLGSGSATRRPAKASVKVLKADSSDSDSEDDMTLSDLKKKMESKQSSKAQEIKKAKGNVTTKRKLKAPTKASNAKPVKKKRQVQSATNDKFIPAKYELVEQILRRWTYCLPSWPEFLEEREQSPGYLSCGFKGVYVGVSSDVMGKMIDFRNHESELAPSQKQLLSVSSEKLRDLLCQGIDRQKSDLQNAMSTSGDPALSVTLQALNVELKNAQKLKPQKIDKEYGNFSR